MAKRTPWLHVEVWVRVRPYMHYTLYAVLDLELSAAWRNLRKWPVPPGLLKVIFGLDCLYALYLEGDSGYQGARLERVGCKWTLIRWPPDHVFLDSLELVSFPYDYPSTTSLSQITSKPCLWGILHSTYCTILKILNMQGKWWRQGDDKDIIWMVNVGKVIYFT